MTNDVRRRAAAALRGLESGWSSGGCYYAIIQTLGLPDTSLEDGGRALYGALADLIDPEPGRSAWHVKEGKAGIALR